MNKLRWFYSIHKDNQKLVLWLSMSFCFLALAVNEIMHIPLSDPEYVYTHLEKSCGEFRGVFSSRTKFSDSIRFFENDSVYGYKPVRDEYFKNVKEALKIKEEVCFEFVRVGFLGYEKFLISISDGEGNTLINRVARLKNFLSTIVHPIFGFFFCFFYCFFLFI